MLSLLVRIECVCTKSKAVSVCTGLGGKVFFFLHLPPSLQVAYNSMSFQGIEIYAIYVCLYMFYFYLQYTGGCADPQYVRVRMYTTLLSASHVIRFFLLLLGVIS